MFPANSSMRGFRGVGGTGDPYPPPPPPPLRFVRCVVLSGYLMGRRGGPMVVFTVSYYCIFFWLALRSPVLYIQFHKCLKNPNHFHVQRVFPSPTSLYTRSLESAFPCLFCPKLFDFTPLKQKTFLGEDPDPSSPPP